LVSVCLSLSEGIHSSHNCHQEQCVLCIETKKLKMVINQMRVPAVMWVFVLIGLYANVAYIFIKKQEKSSLVKWKVRMDH
jgi:hypothetical protein